MGTVGEKCRGAIIGLVKDCCGVKMMVVQEEGIQLCLVSAARCPPVTVHDDAYLCKTPAFMHAVQYEPGKGHNRRSKEMRAEEV